MRIKKSITSLALVIAMLVSVLAFTPRQAEAAGTWTSVWSTSMINSTVGDIIKVKKSSLIGQVVNCKDRTIRTALKVQGTGDKLRIVLANDYGSSALPIKAITVGRTDTSDTRKVKKNTFVSVTYNGQKSFSIPAGSRLTTDDINMSVSAGEMISVSIHYSGEPNTIGLYGGDTYTHVLLGQDFTTNTGFNNVTPISQGEQLYSDDSNATGHYDLIPCICEVDVYGTQMDGCLVVFGDSTVTNEIPTYIAENLRSKGINNISVVNAGIKGNRLIADGTDTADIPGAALGMNGIDRFSRDVLAQANVKYVIVKIGDNDIIHPYLSDMIGKAPATDYYEMQDAYRYLQELAEENGIIYTVCEIAPWKGYTREGTIEWSSEIDQLRVDLNKWIMNAHYADAKFSMDSITDGVALYADETTDGAHPNEKGQRKLADLFTKCFAFPYE